VEGEGVTGEVVLVRTEVVLLVVQRGLMRGRRGVGGGETEGEDLIRRKEMLRVSRLILSEGYGFPRYDRG
jgi:hypothetical protein